MCGLIYGAHQDKARAEVYARTQLYIQLSAFNGYKLLPLALKKLSRYKYYQCLKGALSLVILG